MPNVVIAHGDASTTAVEQEILRAIDARIFYVPQPETLTGLDIAPEVDALMVTTERVSAQVLASLPRCRIVSRVGVGLDAIDIPEATRRGIWVTNVPDFPVDEVSTHTIALLLAHARRLPILFQQARSSIWDQTTIRPFHRLKGQTLGLLGFGRLGQAVAAKALGLGLQVIAYDPYLDAGTINKSGARAVEWQTLLRTSDFISLHAPLNTNNYHILNANALTFVKPTAYIINTARGGLIDHEALLAAIREGRLAGAALDVFEIEPLPPEHPLFHDERVLVTPHVAWYSEESMQDVKVRASEEVVRVLRGEMPRCPVNRVNPASN